MYYAASWDTKITAQIIHCLSTKIWGQISWSALENHQGVVFLPGDSLLHLGRSKLPEVLFQSRHEVQQSGVKTCVLERSFKPGDEVLHLVAIQVNLHKLCHYLNIHHIKVVSLSYIHLVATNFVHILRKMSPLAVDYSMRITNSKNMSLLSGPIPFFHLPTFWLIKISRVATGCPIRCNTASIGSYLARGQLIRRDLFPTFRHIENPCLEMKSEDGGGWHDIKDYTKGTKMLLVEMKIHDLFLIHCIGE